MMHGAYCEQCVVMHKEIFIFKYQLWQTVPGRVAQSVGHLTCTCKSEVLGSMPGLATYFRFSFR